MNKKIKLTTSLTIDLANYDVVRGSRKRSLAPLKVCVSIKFLGRG